MEETKKVVNTAKKSSKTKVVPKNSKAASSTTKKTTSPKTTKKTPKKTQVPVKTTKVVKPVAKVKSEISKVETSKKLDEQNIVSNNVISNEHPEIVLPKNVSKATRVKKMSDVKRPQPKVKVLNKEEKVLFKKLEEAFTYVANQTLVIEEKTMDVKQIPDLAIGELHVVEMVNKNNNKPMSLIAKKLNVTVGSLITCVNRLCQKDYLIRTRDEMDHRVILLSVTPKAKKVLKVHDKFHNDILNLALEGITLANATKVMVQFANVLDNYMNPKEEKKVRK